MIIEIHFSLAFYKKKLSSFLDAKKRFFTPDFYKKKDFLGVTHSEFDLWLAKNFLCRKKHQFSYWNLLQSYKCDRCLTPDYERNEANRHAKLVERNNYYDKLQIPFWKLMGQKPKARDIALDRYLKFHGLTYGQWKQKRDYYEARNPSALSQMMQDSQQDAKLYQKN